MLVHVPRVLDAEQIHRCRTVLAAAEWEDGRATAGVQSAQVKRNLQLPPASLPARELGSLVLGASPQCCPSASTLPSSIATTPR